MNDADPAARSSPPPAPESCAGQLWRKLKLVLAIVYIAVASLISVFGSSLVPRLGPPIGAHLPADSVLVLHLRNGHETWSALENHPSVQALWANSEFQRHTKLQEKWDRVLENWRKKGGFRFFELDRPGLAFALGELAIAVQPKPPGSSGDDDAPGIIFGRVQGARGGLLRLVFWLQQFDKKKKDEHPRLLGGDLVALETKGGSTATPGSGLRCSPPPASAVAFVHAQRDLLKAFPSIWKLTGMDAPERIQLWVEPFGDGGLRASGDWEGPLSELGNPAPLPRPELSEDATPMVDLLVPLDGREAFMRWMEKEVSKGGKKEFRWQLRMGRLAEAGVDLDRDLWPYFGQAFRFQVLPPSEASPSTYATVVCSLPFKLPASQSSPPFAALLAFARAWVDRCYENPPPHDADRPHFVHCRNGPVSRLVWVKSTILRPAFYVSPPGFALISDAGPMATTPLAPKLGASEEASRCIFSLKVDGERLAPHVRAMRELQLKDLRNDVGAAEFLRRVPDERAVTAFAEKLSKLVGHLKIEVQPGPAAANPSEEAPATVLLEWQPRLK